MHGNLLLSSWVQSPEVIQKHSFLVASEIFLNFWDSRNNLILGISYNYTGFFKDGLYLSWGLSISSLLNDDSFALYKHEQERMQYLFLWTQHSFLPSEQFQKWKLENFQIRSCFLETNSFLLQIIISLKFWVD